MRASLVIIKSQKKKGGNNYESGLDIMKLIDQLSKDLRELVSQDYGFT